MLTMSEETKILSDIHVEKLPGRTALAFLPCAEP
jgi:hypothetical protein